jgi:nucleoside-diphosphate-sugar epimerase
MKIDLFGGTGFVGSNFKRLYSDSTHIHDREDDAPICENVLYMISTTHNYHVFDNIHKDVETNLTKLLNVLQNCKDNNIIFNFVSSWFVYGDVDLPAREDSCCKPKGFYSITKRCAEDLIISYCETFKIKYRILRLCNVYGPSDSGVSKQKNALQYLINEIKANNEIKLYYDGDFVRDYMHVDDVCRAIYSVIRHGEHNQIINIGSGISQKFRDIIDFVIKETNSFSKITAVDAVDFHKIVQVKDMYLDVSKLNKLGFKQEINIYQGIKTLL